MTEPHRPPADHHRGTKDPAGQPRTPGKAHPHRSEEPGGRFEKFLATRPEAVGLMLLTWSVAVAGEAVHQVLNVVMSVVNVDVIKANARQAAGDQLAQLEALGEGAVTMATFLAVGISALFSVAILALLISLLVMLAKNTKRSGLARRIWFAFSLYFGVRVLLVFLARPTATDVPDWLYVVDGSVQIVVGVAAVLGLIFSLRNETLDYTGELEQLRHMEQELKEEREKRREKAEQKQKEKQEEKQAKKDRKTKQREKENQSS